METPGPQLKYPLPLQVRVGVVAAQPLGVLADVTSLWAGLRRWDQMRGTPLVTDQWSLQQGAWWGVRGPSTQEACPGAQQWVHLAGGALSESRS